MPPVAPGEAVQQEEPRDRWHEPDHGGAVGVAGAVDEPVALEAELGHRLRVEVVLLLDRLPLRLGDQPRHDGHGLVLLLLQVREEHAAERVERGTVRCAASSDPSAASAAAAASTSVIAGAIASCSRAMRSSTSTHRRLPRRPLADERVEPVVLGGVVGVEEAHHPDEVRADRRGAARRSRGSGSVSVRARSGEVAPQGVVDDAHHRGVGGCVGCGGHGRALLRSGAWDDALERCCDPCLVLLGVHPDSSTSRR